MSRRVLWTRQAEIDLIEIWVYIAEDNRAAAGRTIRAIKSKCDRLMNFPLAGTKRPEILPGIRSLSVGNYVVFYQPGEDVVYIVRVVHGSRDVGNLFA
jgi:toxin ParE1/3/4